MFLATREISPSVWQADWSPESLDAKRIEGLVAGLTPSEEVRQGRRFGLHVLEGDEPLSDIGRHIEATVFDEFFHHDLQEMAEAYGPYDASSTFLTVVDYEQAKPVGVLRVIKPSAVGFKSLTDLVSPTPQNPWYRAGDTEAIRLAEMGDDPDHTIDIATMAIMRDYRSAHAIDGASASLYSSCIRWSLANGYNHWVTIVDEKIYEQMQSWGEPFTAFKDTVPAPYMNSPSSQPVQLELFAAVERVRQFSEQVLAVYLQGAGLDQQYVLPPFPHTVQ